jgi:hypothetical protein
MRVPLGSRDLQGEYCTGTQAFYSTKVIILTPDSNPIAIMRWASSSVVRRRPPLPSGTFAKFQLCPPNPISDTLSPVLPRMRRRKKKG